MQILRPHPGLRNQRLRGRGSATCVFTSPAEGSYTSCGSRSPSPEPSTLGWESWKTLALTLDLAVPGSITVGEPGPSLRLRVSSC